jgi:hypothetical protein
MTKENRELPIVQAFLLAEDIYEDVRTSKKIIVGIFNSVILRKIPGMLDNDGLLFLSITNLHRDAKIHFDFIRLSDRKNIAHYDFTVNSGNSPQASQTWAIPLQRFFIEEPGNYAFDLLCEGRPLATQRLLVSRQPDGAIQ